MALPGENVKIALNVLRDIFGNLPTKTYDPKDEFQTGYILLASRIQDGYEGIYLNVVSISKKQKDEFNRRKKEVRGNSSFYRKYKNGITTVGWF